MAYNIPESNAKTKAVSKLSWLKVSKPTKINIPKRAKAVPIQKLELGLFFKNTNEPIPTQTGDKLANKVA